MSVCQESTAVARPSIIGKGQLHIFRPQLRGKSDRLSLAASYEFQMYPCPICVKKGPAVGRYLSTCNSVFIRICGQLLKADGRRGHLLSSSEPKDPNEHEQHYSACYGCPPRRRTDLNVASEGLKIRSNFRHTLVACLAIRFDAFSYNLLKFPRQSI